MRFLQICIAPEQGLTEFYRRNSRLAFARFDEQIAGLVQDGASADHIMAPCLRELDYEIYTVIADCSQAQHQWAREHHIPEVNPEKWVWEIARCQVETLKPDILCLDLDHARNFDNRFVKSLTWRPKLIIGWQVASIPHETDLSSFDIVLSDSASALEQALKSGAGSAEYFYPGFPAFLAAVCQDEPEIWDVVFAGVWKRGHPRQEEFLLEVAKAPLGWRGEFSSGFFIACSHPEKLPAGIAMHNQGSRWGTERYRALKSGRIVINPGELNEALDPLLFEATGMGVFLLAEQHPNARLFFEPGVEIETFRDAQELIEKIYYYLEHPEERKAIVRRGQERCLREYSRQIQAKELDRLIRERLGRSSPTLDKKRYQRVSFQDMLEKLGKQMSVDLPGLHSMKVGQCLRIKGKMNGDGSLLALEIRPESPLEKAAIDALVQSVDRQKNAIRLCNREFELAANIEITDLQGHGISLERLEPGDRVKVKGKYWGLERFVPEKIKMKKKSPADEVELTGRVNKIDAEGRSLEVLNIAITINEDSRTVSLAGSSGE